MPIEARYRLANRLGRIDFVSKRTNEIPWKLNQGNVMGIVAALRPPRESDEALRPIGTVQVVRFPVAITGVHNCILPPSTIEYTVTGCQKMPWSDERGGAERRAVVEFNSCEGSVTGNNRNIKPSTVHWQIAERR